MEDLIKELMGSNQLTNDPTEKILSALTTKEIEIGKILYGVNLLLQFPLTAAQIAEWAKALNEDRPNLNLDKLRLLIKHARQGKFQWNTRYGIQNIYMGLTYCNKDANYGHVPESFYR